jgi:hypothetical protein
MQTIVTERILYKKEPRLALRFAYDAALVKQVKQVDDAQWSQTLRLWHIPLSEQAYNQLKRLTQELATLSKGETEYRPKQYKHPYRRRLPKQLPHLPAIWHSGGIAKAP